MDAQIAMAEAAQAMLTLAYWQLGLGALGTLFLIITLRESRRSANAAVQAISHQRQIEQAIIEVASFSFTMCRGESFESFAKNRYNLECSFDAAVTNLGQTAAKLESYRISLAILDESGELMFNRDLNGKITTSSRVAAHKETSLTAKNWFDVSEPVYIRLAGKVRAEIRFELTYRDVFAQSRRDEFSYLVELATLNADWECMRVDPSELKPLYASTLHLSS